MAFAEIATQFTTGGCYPGYIGIFEFSVGHGLDSHILRLLSVLVRGALALLRHIIVGHLLHFGKEIGPRLTIDFLPLRVADVLLVQVISFGHALFFLVGGVGGRSAGLLEDLGAARFPDVLGLGEVLRVGGAEDGYVGLAG